MSTLRVNNVTNVAGSSAPYIPGTVLQTVQGTYETQFSTTSTTPVASGLSVTITPKFATSKLLVTVGAFLYQNSAGKYARGTIFRNSINLGEGTNGNTSAIYNGGSDIVAHVSPQVLDSPNTTSPVTYSWHIFAPNGGASYSPLSGNRNTITIMEIAA